MSAFNKRRPAAMIAVSLVLLFLGALLLLAVSGSTDTIRSHDSVTMYDPGAADAPDVPSEGEEIIDDPDIPIPLAIPQMAQYTAVFLSFIIVIALMTAIPFVVSIVRARAEKR